MEKPYSYSRFLYVLKYKEIDGGLQPVPFEIEYVGRIEGSINKPLETKFKIAGKYQSDEVERALKDVVTYSELETVLTSSCCMRNPVFYHQNSSLI